MDNRGYCSHIKEHGSMSDAVKGVVFIEDAINLSHEELKKKFKEAVEKNEINHFEIQTRGVKND